MSRPARFFFMHLGTFVPIILYFNLADRAGYSAPGVRLALTIAFAAMLAYAALARSVGELKQFDVAFVAMFAVGAIGAWAGITPVLDAFQHYSPAILFSTLAITASVPVLLGAEPFTAYYGRRQTPAWQQRLPTYGTVIRIMAGFFTVLFVVAAVLAAWAPRDWRFTLLYPNILTLGVGMSASFWLPPLYLWLVPPPVPDTVEPLLLGMPLVFDRRVARDARASIQFRVSGADAGNYWLRIGRGRCESFTGEAPAADLTIHTPDRVWVGIARGELDGARALADGLYRVEGDYTLLARLGEWFPARR